MNKFINPDAAHILGSTQETNHQSKGQHENQGQPGSKQSLWDQFKVKAKHIWDTIMTVAKEIHENIVPIITSISNFLTAWATFCNRTQKREQQKGNFWCAA